MYDSFDSITSDPMRTAHAAAPLRLRIPTKAASDSNLIAATIPI
jgi:hypothetical protein